MKHLELFAGIGGFRQAMDLISKDLNFPVVNIGYSEIDVKATETYNANFNTENEVALGDIVSWINDKERFESLGTFDFLSGGFPCQTFSMMGKKFGFNEDRGQMFFRIMDVVKYYHPKYILLENVKNLITHDRKKTIGVILNNLEEAGYIVHYDVFNTLDYGLPQKRNRTLIFARLKEFGDFLFNKAVVLSEFQQIQRDTCSLCFYENILEVLEKDVDKRYYLSEKIKPTILSDGSANFSSNSEIDQRIARPLTASMHKMHRACQDNYYSDVFIKSEGYERPSDSLSKEELAKIPIRRITPREAFMLQGFPDNFSENAKAHKIADGALYKQAGNAVSVNTIYAALYYLIKNNIIQ